MSTMYDVVMPMLLVTPHNINRATMYTALHNMATCNHFCLSNAIARIDTRGAQQAIEPTILLHCNVSELIATRSFNALVMKAEHVRIASIDIMCQNTLPFSSWSCLLSSLGIILQKYRTIHIVHIDKNTIIIGVHVIPETIL